MNLGSEEPEIVKELQVGFEKGKASGQRQT